MQISFVVDYHPSGRRTLKMRTQNEMTYRDCEGDLRANDNAGKFYRAVAALLHQHHVAGDSVDYVDTNLDKVNNAPH